jgi:hypothetical protein
LLCELNFLQEKAVEATKQKKKKGGKKNLSPRNRKTCHSTSTALPFCINYSAEFYIADSDNNLFGKYSY